MSSPGTTISLGSTAGSHLGVFGSIGLSSGAIAIEGRGGVETHDSERRAVARRDATRLEIRCGAVH